MLFARDLVGTSDQIAETLYMHAAFREVDEVAFALPFTFGHEDYVQILTDIATRLRPPPGGQPPGWKAPGWHAPPVRGGPQHHRLVRNPRFLPRFVAVL